MIIMLLTELLLCSLLHVSIPILNALLLFVLVTLTSVMLGDLLWMDAVMELALLLVALDAILIFLQRLFPADLSLSAAAEAFCLSF